MNAQEKYEGLKAYLKELGSVAVAFSGGVDSTFLVRAAYEALGDRAIAVTARARLFPAREMDEAQAFCKSLGVPHLFCDFEPLDVEGFVVNPPNRCYLCKHALFTKLWAAAQENGAQHLAEGSNLDDEGDYRPGLVAVRELGVVSPLRTAGLTKAEIRALSKEMGLPTWDKPSFACLASRFPYGQEITAERLFQIDRAEQWLLDMGLRQLRVRMHGDLARIETDEAGFALLTTDRSHREKVYTAFRGLGFAYVALDLMGYRTGSMNETLSPAEKM